MSDYLQESIKLYRETVARFPENVVARNGLAEALKQNGQNEEAIEILSETVARFRNDPVSLISLADALSREGLIERSIKTYKEASAQFPNNPVALTGLAETLRRAADPREEKSQNSNKEIGPYKYQIALSFAGEDRPVAKQIAQGLTDDGVSVFFDEYEQATLWGKDLYQHLQWVYRDSARFCIILISKFYAEKLWTRHELKQAQARAFEENKEYILPLRIDDTDVPGLAKTVGYVDARNTPIQVIVRHVLDKLSADV